MALVRVYCGLAVAQPPRQLTAGSPALSAVVVDDAGRVLDSCDLGDDAYGYAYLSALLAERAAGPYSVAIASDGDRRLVPRLLMTAGWALAVVDEASVADYAQRFADPLNSRSADTDTPRHALGLALALQAGALSATLQPTPPELVELKPVLAGLSALATGRHAAAIALREVLRELYPAALRALPSPADPTALAVLSTVPEPGMLGRGGELTPEAVIDRAVEAGADRAAVREAVSALRSAIAETPRRAGLPRSLAGTVAEAVQQAVAAVRAYDAASSSLVRTLAERVTEPGALPRSVATADDLLAGRQRFHDRATEAGPSIPGPRHAPESRTMPSSAPADSTPVPTSGGAAPAPDPLASEPTTTRPAATRRGDSRRPVSAPPPPPPGITPIQHQPAAEASPIEQRASAPRPSRETGPRGSRQSWATRPPADDEWALPTGASDSTHRWDSAPAAEHRAAREDGPRDRHRQDQPSLRLVEPTLPEELRDDYQQSPTRPEEPSLQVVEDPVSSARVPRSVPPVSADDDDNLLIFEQIRSAWFNQDKEALWNSEIDEGWRAAEQAARPAVGERTEAGLPRRVPHANLVPGAPPNRDRRPLRVVRDPASIAAHTSGYFNGWRRGQEVGGYPLGNRPARRAAGAWEFHRDEDRVS